MGSLVGMLMPRWAPWWALDHSDSKDEPWEVRAEEPYGSCGSLDDGWSQAAKGRAHYLHDADVVGAMQFGLLDHLLLESGKVPLQVLPLAGILLLQV